MGVRFVDLANSSDVVVSRDIDNVLMAMGFTYRPRVIEDIAYLTLYKFYSDDIGLYFHSVYVTSDQILVAKNAENRGFLRSDVYELSGDVLVDTTSFADYVADIFERHDIYG